MLSGQCLKKIERTTGSGLRWNLLCPENEIQKKISHYRDFKYKKPLRALHQEPYRINLIQNQIENWKKGRFLNRTLYG